MWLISEVRLSPLSATIVMIAMSISGEFVEGMATSAGGQYQFDGNAGVMAAVHEMLMQSHVPLESILCCILLSRCDRYERIIESL